MIEEARSKGVELEFHLDVKILEIATIALYSKIMGFLDCDGTSHLAKTICI
ncbi:hypothetical protein OROMI_018799 [Orobanche minor]